MQKLILKWILSVAVFLHRVTGGRVGGSMTEYPFSCSRRGGANLAKSARFHWSILWMVPPNVITTSAGGADKHPGWFFNVRSNPNVTIQVKDKRIQAVAEVAGPEKKSELWSQLLKVAPGF